MKKIIGALIAVLSIAIIGIIILKIFGIVILSLAFVLKGFESLILLGVLLLVLLIIYGFFFKKQDKGYATKGEGISQRKL